MIYPLLVVWLWCVFFLVGVGVGVGVRVRVRVRVRVFRLRVSGVRGLEGIAKTLSTPLNPCGPLWTPISGPPHHRTIPLGLGLW